MNKIIKALLEAKYPTANSDSLLEIINATPNPVLATEILCGLHVEVSLYPMSNLNKDRQECRLLEYNKWTGEVKYEYSRYKTIGMYLPKELDTSVVTEDNWKAHAVKWSNDVPLKSYELTTAELVTDTGFTNLEAWEKGGYYLSNDSQL